MPRASASRTRTGIKNVGAETRDVLHRIGMQIKRLALRSDESGIEERQGIAADLHVIAGAAKAGHDIAVVDGLRGLAADADPDAQQAVGGRRIQRPLCGMPLGKSSAVGTSRAIDETLKPVKTSSIGVLRAPWMSAEIAAAEVDEVEDALLVELIGIVEIAGDDPRAAGQRLDVAVDERLIEKAALAAGRIAGVVAFERTESIDEAIGLRAVIVREHLEVLADHDRIRLARRHDARHRHRLRAAGELPEQLIAAAECVGRAGRGARD